MIQEYYNAGFQEFLEKISGLGSLAKVKPGINLPAASLIRNPAASLAKAPPPVRPQTNPSAAWQHGSVINYNKGAPSVRPRSAGEV